MTMMPTAAGSPVRCRDDLLLLKVAFNNSCSSTKVYYWYPSGGRVSIMSSG